MADLNKLLDTVRSQAEDAKQVLERLLLSYENLYKEASSIYREETMGNNSLEGMEDFYRLLQVTRRNRDVVGSMFRGIRGLRSMASFRFVEEDVPEKKEKEIDEEQIKNMLTMPATTEGANNG